MAKSESKVRGSLQPPLVKQFSAFLENKVGALLDLTRTLGESNVHVCGISVVDSADASVVRMVVDEPRPLPRGAGEGRDRCERIKPSRGRIAARPGKTRYHAAQPGRRRD